MSEKAEVGFSISDLWVFFALAYGLSWLFWIPAVLSGQDINATAWLVPYVLGGFGPSVAGIIMVYRRRGKEGRRDFWKRVVDFKRISAGWYLFILLIFPALFSLSLLLDFIFSGSIPALEALAQIAANPLMLVGMTIIGIITGPLSEELGWRGFALDRFQARWSGVASSLTLGLFWWGWHLPLFFMKGTTQHEWGLGSLRFWLFLLAIVPLSILLTWAYNHNRKSILAAVLLHFTYNFTLGLVYPVSTTVLLYQVGLLFITAFGVIVVFGRLDARHTG